MQKNNNTSYLMLPLSSHSLLFLHSSMSHFCRLPSLYLTSLPLLASMCLSLSLPPQTSVLHMCSLFHAFMFAQLWTVYCEQAAATPSLQNQNLTEYSSGAILTGLEFWSRVTPSILQLMAHNKVVRRYLHLLGFPVHKSHTQTFTPPWLPSP